MANSLIGALRIALGIDSGGFNDGLSKAEMRAKTAFGNIGKGAGALGRSLGALAVAAGAAFTASAVQGALDYAASIGEVAEQVGVTTRTLQTFRYAGTQVNLTSEEVEKGLARLTRSIGEGNKAFADLGIRLRNEDGSLRSTEAVLFDVADAIQGIDDPAKRAAVAVDIFGKAGQKMLPLLSQGAEGLRKFYTEADAAGAVLSDELISQADIAADSIARFKQVMQVSFAKAVSQNVAAVDSLADALGRMVVAAVNAIGYLVALKQENTRLQQEGVGFFGRVKRFVTGETNDNIARSRREQEILADIKRQRALIDAQKAGSAAADAAAAALEKAGKASKSAGKGATEAKPPVDELGESLKRLMATLYPVQETRNQFNEDLAVLDQSLKAGKITADQYTAALDELKARLANDLFGQAEGVLAGASGDEGSLSKGFDAQEIGNVTKPATDAFEAATQESVRFADSVAGSVAFAVEDSILQFKSLGDAAKNLLAELTQLFVRQFITRQIFGAISGAIGGTGFAGGFASGGTIPRGQWGVVGEAGPEIVYAKNSPMNVIANKDLPQGGTSNTFNVNVNGAMNDRDARRTGKMIAAEAGRELDRSRRQGIVG